MKETLSAIPIPDVLRPVVPPQLALNKVTSKNNLGVYASSDTLFKGAVFGRDSIEVAEDLLPIRQRMALVGKIILTLASLQGEVNNPVNEEEPGKIIHEYRSTMVDGKPIKGKQRQIFEELSSRWGGDEHKMVYFGSVDSTPHFLRLLGSFTEKYGDNIMKRKVELRSGHTISMALAAENATDWVLRKINSSSSGLIEYHRTNPQGVLNQVWKDSNEFYVHEDGTKVNHRKPIASIEVQGLAYDGLLAAAKLIPAQKEKYLHAAQQLRERVIQLLWMPETEYFGLGLDYDQDDIPRIIKTHTANPAALLDTKIFDDLDESTRRAYLSGIVKNIISPDYLTDAGIRSRALSHAKVVPYWDYHGSFVTWPKETYDIAKGLRRQGFPRLARELENRLLNVVLKMRDYPEFVYVDSWMRVLSVAPVAKKHGSVVTMVDSTNIPETTQAWTVSAILGILSSRVKQRMSRQQSQAEGWQSSLENQLMAVIPRVPYYINPMKLAARYPTYPSSLIEATQRASGVKFFAKDYKKE